MKNRVSGIGRKLWISVILILAIVFLGMYIANSYILSSVYLSQMRSKLKSASERLLAAPDSQWELTVRDIEERSSITTILVPIVPNETSFNANLRWQL